MAVFDQIVFALLPLFLLMSLGALARRIGLLERHASGLLSSYALDVALPALILSTLLTNKLSARYALLPVAMWAATAVGLGVVFMGARALRLKRGSQGVALFGVFGNTSFVGYPITTALFPALLPAAVIIDQLGMSLLMYAAMPPISDRYGEIDDEERARRASQSKGRRVWSFIKSPLLLALIVGLALRGLLAVTGLFDALLGSRAGALTVDTLHLLGGSAIPVIMIALGMRLNPSSVRRHLPTIGLIGIVKLIVMPIVAYAFSRWVLHLHGGLLSVSTLQAAVPPAATSVVFAIRHKTDSDLALALFFALTVASAAILPLMVSWLR